MNTNLLRKFAQETRIRLLEAVKDKLNYILNGDSAGLRDYADAIQTLKKDIKSMGEEALIDKVAYTWFNRLMALRFMDVNDYQPLGLKVISPKPGHTQPELLDEATQGHIPEDLEVDRERIHDLLDGNIDVLHPQNEVYRMLLIASCNYLHGLFPFLFEKIGNYTELLLPDDLISELSILQDFVKGMTEEDCQETEMIGWLYQFYISDKKDEVFAKRGRVEKDEIPAATQLFTPRWIVEYMVQNTVGKLWLQNHPDSALRDKMPYYIETESSKGDEYLKIDSPEEITLLDQACGSGHILVYGFELLYQIYEEAGYTASQIPQLIIEKNLVGYEIDERAAQLASFSILMKARSYYRRLFRKSIQPHILCFQDLRLTADEIEAAFAALDHEINDDLKHDLQCMQQATNFGSLIQPRTSSSELKTLKEILQEKKETDDLFLSESFRELYTAISQLIQLSEKFHCVVQNPPYMGSGKMNKDLSHFVGTNYPKAKSDLFSCFIERSISKSFSDGIIGNVTMESWMFLSSFEKFRKSLLQNVSIDSLSHFGWHIMRIAFGTVSFILRNSIPKNTDFGVYNYLEIDDIDKENERPRDFPNKIRRYAIRNQEDFAKIPGNNIGYWLSDNLMKLLMKQTLSDHGKPREGMATGNNNKYVRYWPSVNYVSIKFNTVNPDENMKWFPYNKDGQYRKWYGNQYEIINWFNNGYELQNTLHPSGKRIWAHNFNLNFIFKPFISWSSFGAKEITARYFPPGFLFDSSGLSYFPNDKNDYKIVLAFVNSKITPLLSKIINSGLSFKPGYFGKIPYPDNARKHIIFKEHSLINIRISKQEWNSRETSWDFKQNELIRMKAQGIKEAIELYKAFWTKKFIQLHRNEEELNARFIEIYGLQEELTPDVPLDEITILREELDQRKLKKISKKFSSGWNLEDGDQWIVDGGGSEAPMDGDQWMVDGISATRRDGERREEESVISHPSQVANPYPLLPFDEKELVKQFISYAVGCMMGRYSLEKPGLILANQGESISDYVRIVDGGQWTVSRPQDEMVDGEDENKNKSYDTGLQGSADMAAEHGFGGDGLSGDGKDAEGRAVQSEEFSKKEIQPLITKNQSPFLPDDDGIIPVLDSEWFEDDIVTQFRDFVRAVWGEQNLKRNMEYIEKTLGKPVRDYFYRDFYDDHLRRYKKRPN